MKPMIGWLCKRKQHCSQSGRWFISGVVFVLTDARSVHELQKKWQTVRFVTLLKTWMAKQVMCLHPQNGRSWKRCSSTVRNMSCINEWDLLSQVKILLLAMLSLDTSAQLLRAYQLHSTAMQTERIFSPVNKNKTVYRPNMSTQTLSSRLTHKMMQTAQFSVCHSKQYSNTLWKFVKSATCFKCWHLW